MADDTLQLRGKLTYVPNPVVDQRGVATTLADLSGDIAVKNYVVEPYTLNTDGDVAISLGGLAAAHIVAIDVDQPCLVKLTSTAGTTQIVPVQGLLYIESLTTAFTAITISRPSGIVTTARVVLVEKSSS